MKIVLTGSTGFVGSHIYSDLSSEHEIQVLTRENYLNIINDVETETNLNLFKSADVVIHTAAIVGERTDVDYKDYYKINVLGTKKLLSISMKYGVSKFVHLSTGGVYVDSKTTNDEVQSVSGHSSKYVLSKLLSEVACLKYEDKMNILILRLFFPFGVKQSTGLLKTLYNKVISTGEVLIHKDNAPLISMIHIDSFISVLRCFLDKNISGTFNIAGNNSISIFEIVNIIADECNINEINYTQSNIESSNYLSSNLKLLEKLNIEPFGDDLESDIRMIIKHWRQNAGR